MASFSHWQKSIPLPLDFVNKYMLTANATYVKVYLYGLAKCYDGSEDISNADIADALDILETDVSKAWRYWKKVGLIRTEGKSSIIFEPVPSESCESKPTKKEASSEELTQKKHDKKESREICAPTMKDVTSAMKIDKKMKETVSMAEHILKRPLSQREIMSLYNYMDWYKMSGELILTLLEYCVSIEKTSFAYIEKVAKSWHDEGVCDVAAASKMITRASRENRMQHKCKKIFGLERAFSSNEAKYISSWVNEFGSSESLIKAAYERTVNNTGTLSFPYMNTILRAWHEKGIKTVSQIKEKEGAKPQTSKAASSSGYELDEMAALERKLRLAKNK